MNDIQQIPYIVYEGEQVRHERNIKRLIVALVISIVLLFLSNAGWLIYMAQYDFCAYKNDVDIDSKDGIANYIGNDGDIANGKNSCKKTIAPDAEEKEKCKRHDD